MIFNEVSSFVCTALISNTQTIIINRAPMNGNWTHLMSFEDVILYILFYIQKGVPPQEKYPQEILWL